MIRRFILFDFPLCHVVINKYWLANHAIIYHVNWRRKVYVEVSMWNLLTFSWRLIHPQVYGHVAWIWFLVFHQEQVIIFVTYCLLIITTVCKWRRLIISHLGFLNFVSLIFAQVVDWSNHVDVRIFSIPSDVDYARNHGIIQIGENVSSDNATGFCFWLCWIRKCFVNLLVLLVFGSSILQCCSQPSSLLLLLCKFFIISIIHFFRNLLFLLSVNTAYYEETSGLAMPLVFYCVLTVYVCYFYGTECDWGHILLGIRWRIEKMYTQWWTGSYCKYLPGLPRQGGRLGIWLWVVNHNRSPNLRKDLNLG